jgi:hypothetical protein
MWAECKFYIEFWTLHLYAFYVVHTKKNKQGRKKEGANYSELIRFMLAIDLIKK